MRCWRSRRCRRACRSPAWAWTTRATRPCWPRASCPRVAHVIERYTRPEMGALWTDAARMETWRQVEVAACEAMDGPAAEELDAIRAATFTVEAVHERERVTDHDVAA